MMGRDKYRTIGSFKDFSERGKDTDKYNPLLKNYTERVKEEIVQQLKEDKNLSQNESEEFLDNLLSLGYKRTKEIKEIISKSFSKDENIKLCAEKIIKQFYRITMVNKYDNSYTHDEITEIQESLLNKLEGLSEEEYFENAKKLSKEKMIINFIEDEFIKGIDYIIENYYNEIPWVSVLLKAAYFNKKNIIEYLIDNIDYNDSDILIVINSAITNEMKEFLKSKLIIKENLLNKLNGPTEEETLNYIKSIGPTQFLFKCVYNNSGYCDGVKLAIENGADINAKNNYDLTPFDYAFNNKHFDIVELLLINNVKLKKDNINIEYFIKQIYINCNDINLGFRIFKHLMKIVNYISIDDIDKIIKLKDNRNEYINNYLIEYKKNIFEMSKNYINKTL